MPEKGVEMFEWKYHAFIYCATDGRSLYDEKFDSYEEAKKAIEENITKFASDSLPPTGHINNDYVQISFDLEREMTIKELGEKCKARDIDCKECPYEKACSKLPAILEDISPSGLLEILDNVIN